MDFQQSTPKVIAAAIAEEIGRKVEYRDVERHIEKFVIFSS